MRGSAGGCGGGLTVFCTHRAANALSYRSTACPCNGLSALDPRNGARGVSARIPALRIALGVSGHSRITDSAALRSLVGNSISPRSTSRSRRSRRPASCGCLMGAGGRGAPARGCLRFTDTSPNERYLSCRSFLASVVHGVFMPCSCDVEEEIVYIGVVVR